MTDIKRLEVNADLFMEKSSFGFEVKPNVNDALPNECKIKKRTFYTTNEQSINETRPYVMYLMHAR